jgi:excisionase family DNA binding protein
MRMRLLTLREVAQYLRVHPGTVYRLVKSGQLQAARVGRDLRFDSRVVDDWVAKGGTGGSRSDHRTEHGKR